MVNSTVTEPWPRRQGYSQNPGALGTPLVLCCWLSSDGIPDCLCFISPVFQRHPAELTFCSVHPSLFPIQSLTHSFNTLIAHWVLEMQYCIVRQSVLQGVWVAGSKAVMDKCYKLTKRMCLSLAHKEWMQCLGRPLGASFMPMVSVLVVYKRKLG